MLKNILMLLIVVTVFAGQSLFAQNVTINVRGDVQDRLLIKDLVHRRLVKDSQMKLSKVNVKVEPGANGKRLLVHLIAQDVYYYETVRMELKRDNSVRRITRNLRPISSVVRLSLCPDNDLDMVFATPVDDISTAVAGVLEACDTARAQGYSCKTLIGSQATVLAYKRYLSCKKLRAFGSIGHGNPYGILLANHESLSYSWFNLLSPTYLNGLVHYLNSCQVHNSPLEPAIMSAGTRTYIGGNINLGIGPSENVFKCFWREVLREKEKMGDSLNYCESTYYPTSAAHGLSGSVGYFTWFRPIRPLPPIIRPIDPPRPIRPPRPIPIPRPIPYPRG